MREDYRKAANAEIVLGFVYDRLKKMQAEQVEKGDCDGINAYNYILECINYAKVCVRCRRLGYVMLASTLIIWVVNMLSLIGKLSELF